MQADGKRIEGFQASCLRKSSGVLPSFLPRMSNKTVLGKFTAASLSIRLMRRQLQLFGKLARQPADSLTRQAVLQDSGVRLKDWRFERRVGRPCLRWGQCVFDLVVKASGNDIDKLESLLQSSSLSPWKEIVKDFHG